MVGCNGKVGIVVSLSPFVLCYCFGGAGGGVVAAVVVGGGGGAGLRRLRTCGPCGCGVYFVFSRCSYY